MAPRTRTKSTKIGRLQRQPTQFGELETTPTSRHHQAPDGMLLTGGDQPFVPNGRENRQPFQSDMFDNDLEDVDLIKLDHDITSQQTQSKTFAWSEAGSLTRRSSPVRSGETPRDIWQFGDDESLAPFSSPKPDTNMLPDTVPLPPETQSEEQQRLQTERRVDFSETASTVRRSSPFGLGDALKEIWDFHKSPSTGAFSTVNVDNGNLPDTLPIHSTSSPPHLPLDELYDATPYSKKPRQTVQDNEDYHNEESIISRNGLGRSSLQEESGEKKAIAKEIDSGEAELNNALHETPSGPKPQQESALTLLDKGTDPRKSLKTESKPKKAYHGDVESTDELQHQQPSFGSPAIQPPSVENQKGKKRKQRAKAPIQFDEATQEVKKPPQAKKKPRPAPPRLPVVSTLQESAKSSSSPVVVPRKRPAVKSTQPKKKGKTAAPKPPQETPTAASTLKSVAVEQCLAPSKPPTKRELEASRENKLTPCSGKEVGKENCAEEHVKPVIIPDSPEGPSDGDSPFPPPNTSRVSWMEKVQGKRRIQSSSLGEAIPEIKAKRVKPGVPVITGDAFDERLEPSPVMVQNISEARNQPPPNGWNTEGNIKGTTQKVLTERDPNISIKRPLSPLKRRASLKPSATDKQDLDRIEDTVRGQQLAGKRLSRQFSVSEQGSPVPVKRAARIDIPFEERGGLVSVEAGLSHNHRHRNFPGRDSDSARISDSPILPGIGTGEKRISNAHIGVSQRITTDGDAPSSSWRQMTDQPSDLASAHRQRHGVNDELRAQILASFLEQNKGDTSDQNMHEHGSEREDKSHVKKSSTQGNDISKQLHRIIDQLTAHLASKEATVHKVAEIYHRSGIESAGRLQRRCVKEHNALAGTFHKDGVRFENATRKAKEAIEKSSRDREKSVLELEESLAHRRLMYERASTSLRGLHGQLLGEQKAQLGKPSED